MPNVKDKDGSVGGRVKETISSFGSSVAWTVGQIKEKANHILCEYGDRIGEHVVSSVEDAIHKTFPFIDTASNAIKTDMGILQFLSNVKITYKGATWKDKLQYSIGLCEMLLGTFITGAGGAATVISGGTTGVVSVPMVMGGTATFTLGYITAVSALANMYEIQFFQSSGDGGGTGDEIAQGKSPWKPAEKNGQLWSKGKLKEHFMKHGSEFGANSPQEYSDMAVEFGTRDSEDIVQTIYNGYLYRYEPATDTIFVGTMKGGKIKSFYKWDGRVDDFVITILKERGLI
jgi:hypothetical protein